MHVYICLPGNFKSKTAVAKVNLAAVIKMKDSVAYQFWNHALTCNEVQGINQHAFFRPAGFVAT